MDNSALAKVIGKINWGSSVKYLGSFPPFLMIPPPLMNVNTFQILNTTNNSVGKHWIVLIRANNGSLFYGDSLGSQSLKQSYPDLHTELGKYKTRKCKPLVNIKLQQTADMCGLYAIYFAYQCLVRKQTKAVHPSEYELLKFMHKFVK